MCVVQVFWNCERLNLDSMNFLHSIILAIFHFLRIPMCNFLYLYLELYKFKNYKKVNIIKACD